MSHRFDLDLEPERELKPEPELKPELEHQQEQQRQQVKVGKDVVSRRVENQSISKDASTGPGQTKVSKQPDQGGGDAPETVSPLPAKVKPAPQLCLTERLALRPNEAAASLGVSDRTLRDWMRNEDLPYLQIDRGILIPTAELIRWMEERVKTHSTTDALVDEILDGF